MGMALDFLAGLTMSAAPMSMGPKMELPPWLLSPPPDTTELEMEWRGVKAGASGRNLGPETEKLKSLCAGEKAWPGEKAGALTLILDELGAEVGKLNWLEWADNGGTGAADTGLNPAWNTVVGGWTLLLKTKGPGLKAEVVALLGSNLNSGASTLSLEMDVRLPWLGRRLPPLRPANAPPAAPAPAPAPDLPDSLSVQGLLAVETDRW
ncbi:hypothetical protein VTK73DRAFT_5292 [Phialemonium thermophilum]|uniref:Plastid lipid-associated protein/fibrillin conserved domain-containing protein n=1 Tax=Phialemonium thermophilum TaxID=223376 RepID=A0ABR3V328_9PEZI